MSTRDTQMQSVITPRWVFGLICGIILADQFSKTLLLSLTKAGEIPRAILPFFNLVMVDNTGVSFGMLNGGGGGGRLLLISLSLIISLFVALWLRRAETIWLRCGLTLVLGGAIGNLSDRIWRGAVVDFLDFHIAGWHWPAFNLADSAICIGVGLILLDGLRPQPKTGSPTGTGDTP